jgi:hypothetical protein
LNTEGTEGRTESTEKKRMIRNSNFGISNPKRFSPCPL